jgi:hypothetical protein
MRSIRCSLGEHAWIDKVATFSASTFCERCGKPKDAVAHEAYLYEMECWDSAHAVGLTNYGAAVAHVVQHLAMRNRQEV